MRSVRRTWARCDASWKRRPRPALVDCMRVSKFLRPCIRRAQLVEVRSSSTLAGVHPACALSPCERAVCCVQVQRRSRGPTPAGRTARPPWSCRRVSPSPTWQTGTLQALKTVTFSKCVRTDLPPPEFGYQTNNINSELAASVRLYQMPLLSISRTSTVFRVRVYICLKTMIRVWGLRGKLSTITNF
jgi:hypothetical protein